MQADARKMPDEPSHSYSIIVDKGTLDAIAAGGDSANDKVQMDLLVFNLRFMLFLE